VNLTHACNNDCVSSAGSIFGVQIVNIVNIVNVVQRTLKNVHGKWVKLFQCYKFYQRLREHPRAVNTEQCFFLLTFFT